MRWAPEVLDLIPQDDYFDMPSLFEKLVAQKGNDANLSR